MIVNKQGERRSWFNLFENLLMFEMSKKIPVFIHCPHNCSLVLNASTLYADLNIVVINLCNDRLGLLNRLNMSLE